jgi:ketosteroid isomerase-like protein
MPGFSITWEPELATVSAQYDIGYLVERNRFTFTDSDSVARSQTGKGVTIWRKDPSGAWKCVIDIWNNNPTERVLPSSSEGR